jgi:Tfp pilus assembly protein PilF
MKSNISEIEKEVLRVMSLKKWSKAIALLNEELPTVKKDWKLSWNLGWCYFKLRQLGTARVHMERSRRLAPNNAIALWGLGVLHLYAHDYKKAQLYLKRSLLRKESYVCRVALAVAYLKQKRPLDAGRVYVDGMKKRPNDYRLYEAFGDLLWDVGDKARAAKQYQKAKQLKSNRV